MLAGGENRNLLDDKNKHTMCSPSTLQRWLSGHSVFPKVSFERWTWQKQRKEFPFAARKCGS